MIYKPDRVARSMKELLVLLEDQLHARGINLHILTGICAGRPAVNDDILAIARARRQRGESVTAIALHLGVGRSTLYRALDLGHASPASPAAGATG